MNRILIAVLLAGALTACKHMDVPAEIKGDAIPIDEKPGIFSGNLRFGPFKALDIDKGWIHGGSSTTTWFSKVTETELSQDFSFRFEEQGQAGLVVACRAGYVGSKSETKLFGAKITSSEGNHTLDCKFGAAGAAAPDGILRLSDEGPGRLELHETVFEVMANNRFEGGATSTNPLGYVLSNNGQAVAAVDKNMVGAWMKKDIAGALRTGAGLGSAILLLYQPQEPPR
jgi:hypothetical protein